MVNAVSYIYLGTLADLDNNGRRALANKTKNDWEDLNHFVHNVYIATWSFLTYHVLSTLNALNRGLPKKNLQMKRY